MKIFYIFSLAILLEPPTQHGRYHFEFVVPLTNSQTFHFTSSALTANKCCPFASEKRAHSGKSLDRCAIFLMLLKILRSWRFQFLLVKLRQKKLQKNELSDKYRVWECGRRVRLFNTERLWLWQRALSTILVEVLLSFCMRR
jgi:hypothetical protein